MVGQTISHFRILAKLGEGGMGEVYRATDLKLNREVAIKILRSSLAEDPDRIARFRREAQVLAAINHPNIAAIYGVEDRALVIELVDGKPLKGPLPVERALSIAFQFAEALEYAHEKGIVHRDLKPANILVTPDGKVKLLDFGLAHVVNASWTDPTQETLTDHATQPGTVMGTAAYMSPEQARGDPVDKRTDIWAFGAVLYEITTGKRPFEGRTTTDVLAGILSRDPDWDAVPARLRKLVRHAMEKDPRRRLRDIGDLRHLIGEPSVAPQRRVWPWQALSAALTVLLILGFWVASRRTGDKLAIARLRIDPGEGFDVGVFGSSIDLGVLGSSVVISPDGNRLVSSIRTPDGRWQLYTRTLDQEQAVPIVGTEGASQPFFSPDGQSIGFFAGGKLKKTSVQGGAAISLCDAQSLRGASWGDDGNIVAALNNPSGLSLIPSNGGPVKDLVPRKQADVDYTRRWPQVLPGSKAVLFTANDTAFGFADARIEAQFLESGEKKTLVRGGYFGRYAGSGHLLYVYHGTLYVAPMDADRLILTGPAVALTEEVANNPGTGVSHMDIARNGTLVYVKTVPTKSTLAWLHPTGQTTPMREIAAPYGLLRLSPDGRRLATVVNEKQNEDIWLYDWKQEQMTRLSFGPKPDRYPVWGPDSEYLVFASSVHGAAENMYWTRASGAGEAVRLTRKPVGQYPAFVSPDGKWLVFAEVDPKSGWDIWKLPIEGANNQPPTVGTAVPFLATRFNERRPAISPDGRWLAYMSDEFGRSEVFVRPSAGNGGPWQISTAGGGYPRWATTIRELFYLGGDGSVMVAAYSAAGEGFSAETPRRWTDRKVGSEFEVAPDGKRVAFVERVAIGKPEVMFIENFFTELRRRTLTGNGR